MSAARPAARRDRARKAPRRTGQPAAWTKDPQGRRQRVLDGATRLFAERGYAAVSTGDIARAAGVAEGNIYHYFGSKPELLRAVGERYGAEFAAAMFAGIEPVAAVKTIEAVVKGAFGFVGGNWPGFGLFLLSDGPSPAPLAQKANRLTVTRAVEAVLEDWSARGLLDPVDAPVVSELLFGLVEAALRTCFAGDGSISRRRCVAQTVRAISRILGIDGRRA